MHAQGVCFCEELEPQLKDSSILSLTQRARYSSEQSFTQHLKPNQNDLVGYPDLLITTTELWRAPVITRSCDKGGESAAGLLIMATHSLI